jgi:hypothetical protein
MMRPSPSPSPFSSFIALFGRILLAAIFLVSGIGKVSDASGTIGYIASSGLPLPEMAYALALGLELGGAVLLLLGYQSRGTALLMAVLGGHRRGLPCRFQRPEPAVPLPQESRRCRRVAAGLRVRRWRVERGCHAQRKGHLKTILLEEPCHESHQ